MHISYVDYIPHLKLTNVNSNHFYNTVTFSKYQLHFYFSYIVVSNLTYLNKFWFI